MKFHDGFNKGLLRSTGLNISGREYTRGVQKVLQIDIQKIHKALEFDFI